MNDSNVNLGFAAIFAFFGLVVLAFGIIIFTSSPANSTEWNMAFLAVASGLLMLYGSYKTRQNNKNRVRAEAIENRRIAQSAQQQLAVATAKTNLPEIEVVANKDETLFIRWIFSKEAWTQIMKKLIKKTLFEELFTAVWFPILAPIIYQDQIFVSILVGVVLAILYLAYQYYYAKNLFGGTRADAEIIITDSYLRINGHFISYADGKNYLKDVTLENDKNLGSVLHFCIGWQTNRGYNTHKDLYVPVPKNGKTQAAKLLHLYQQAKNAHV